MKSIRITVALLFFCCICFAVPEKENVRDALNQKKALDSLYFPKAPSELTKASAKEIINTYLYLSSEGVKLSIEDYKRLATSYAILGDTLKTSEYVTKYIKNAHTVDILNKEEFKRFEGAKAYDNIIKKYKPELNGWILFFFSTGLLGLYIAVFLNLRKKGDIIANLLISGFVLIHSLFMIHLSLFLSKFNFKVPHTLYISTSFSFLYGPLIYFYFKRISKEYKFKKIDLLHLTPTVFLFLFFLPIYLKGTEEKLHLLYNRDEILHSILTTVVILKGISLTTYGFLIFRIYFKSNNDNLHIAIRKWKKNILMLNSVYVVTYIIYGIALINIVMTQKLIYPQIFAMCVIVLYVAYTAYVQPSVFSKKHLFNEKSLKYEKSGLTENYSLELKEQLIKLLNDEKVYKANDISLNSLSDRMGVTRHNLSQVINEHFDLNFFNLINKYRIQEAQQILRNDLNKNLNIIDIAYDVGFNNKVTFNKAFKEETKLTPTQYLKVVQQRVHYG